MALTALKTHLAVLDSCAPIFASSPVFKIPQLSERTGRIERWDSISYQQFHSDVEVIAKYWSQALQAHGIPSKSIVGLWLSGWTYSDVVQFYGMSRAGYIPQLFSLRLPNPDVVFELLVKTGAKALIYEPSYGISLENSPVSLHKAVDIRTAYGVHSFVPLPPITMPANGDETAFIFHTSGSTSGSPKVVPCSYRWLDSIIHKAEQVSRPRDPRRSDVTTWMGSACHIGQTFMLIGFLQHGACTIIPTELAFSSDELSVMVDQCGLNRLNQFATFLAKRLKESYTNPKLLGLLRSLDEILYSGLSLSCEEETWAYSNGLLLKNLFGSTECGAMMLSIGDRCPNASLLRPLEGVSYRFSPVDSPADVAKTAKAGPLEMIVLSDSRDCPDSSLRSKVDGHFHTGDLFEEVASGLYVFRGRDDDWIKSDTGLRTDTKAIEDNIRDTCPDLVAECVVVGNGRPSPVIFIEPMNGDFDHIRLKGDVFQRTENFNARRYLHERIMNVDMIVVVDRGSLPRTSNKGNVRRRAVEEDFKAKLDHMYSA